MDDQLGGNVQSNPHWTGDTSEVICSDGSFSIPARALNITWGNDPRYWEWTKIDETESKLAGFEEGARLQQVNWLEVTGRFELMTSSITKMAGQYKVYYVMKFNEDAFGWSHAVIKFKVRLHDERDGGAYSEMEVNLQQYREKPGTWHQVYVGEFNVVGNASSVNVEVGMFEVETDWWKGSVVLGGIRIEPNNC